MAVDIKATNVTWHEGHATRAERNGLLRQQGATLWFTGLSGSGKSTVAFTLEHPAHIDRHGLGHHSIFGSVIKQVGNFGTGNFALAG